MQHVFRILRYTGSETTLKDDFAKALKIYIGSTPATIKTNSNEISSWISDSTESHVEVLVFILYCDDVVVGFAMMTYYKHIHIMAYEYISIENNYSSFASYFAYLDLLNNYTTENGYDVLYWMTDISNEQYVDKESNIFKKLLCLHQFGKLDAYFRTFPIGLDKDSIFDAVIFIKSNDRIDKISKDKYLKIVEAIRDYYSIWYKKFMKEEDFKNYNTIVQEIYVHIKKNLDFKDTVPISYIDCPLLTPGEQTHTVVVPKEKERKRKKWMIPVAIAGIIIVSSIIAVICWSIFKKLNIDISSISIIIANVLTALLTSFITWYFKLQQ